MSIGTQHGTSNKLCFCSQPFLVRSYFSRLQVIETGLLELLANTADHRIQLCSLVQVYNQTYQENINFRSFGHKKLKDFLDSFASLSVVNVDKNLCYLCRSEDAATKQAAPPPNKVHSANNGAATKTVIGKRLLKNKKRKKKKKKSAKEDENIEKTACSTTLRKRRTEKEKNAAKEDDKIEKSASSTTLKIIEKRFVLMIRCLVYQKISLPLLEKKYYETYHEKISYQKFGYISMLTLLCSFSPLFVLRYEENCGYYICHSASILTANVRPEKSVGGAFNWRETKGSTSKAGKIKGHKIKGLKISFPFVYTNLVRNYGVKWGSMIKEERVAPVDEQPVVALNKHFYQLEYAGLRALRTKSGSQAGLRKELRMDHTWDNYAMKPRNILTNHAYNRLKERGQNTLPRYVNGTNKTVVVTYVPCKLADIKKFKFKQKIINKKRNALAHRSECRWNWKARQRKQREKRAAKIKKFRKKKAFEKRDIGCPKARRTLDKKAARQQAAIQQKKLDKMLDKKARAKAAAKKAKKLRKKKASAKRGVAISNGPKVSIFGSKKQMKRFANQLKTRKKELPEISIPNLKLKQLKKRSDNFDAHFKSLDGPKPTEPIHHLTRLGTSAQGDVDRCQQKEMIRALFKKESKKRLGFSAVQKSKETYNKESSVISEFIPESFSATHCTMERNE